ncbi:hypothetical protein [Mitsuokella multacida]|uniref:hypothetical protein n=1 Tax=Mitsuokella multacida TaxID=52226 RepID=UPI0026DBD347|nr:hypothetical protein [Mitsuokella multacida]
MARLMYKDTMTVYRVSRVQADDGSDDYEESETPVLRDVPCKLSQYSKDLLMAKTAQAATVHIDLRVCCAPDVDIREQDRLVVKHQGQTFELFAGTRFAYPTHQEISVRTVREAKQNGV